MKPTESKEEHRSRVSGISGRTVGRMMRKTKTKPSSEHRGLRSRNQMKPPFSDKKRFPSGKFRPAGTPIGTSMDVSMEMLPSLIQAETARLVEAKKRNLGLVEN